MYKNLVILALFVLGYSIIAGRIERSWISGPIVFTAAGVILGPNVLGLLRLDLDAEDLRPHYPLTLLHWVRRLEAQREDAIKAAGVERYRIWRMYMAGMAHAFDRGWLSVGQVLAQKNLDGGGMAPRPWTRHYQYLPAARLRLSKGLDWADL